MQTVLTTGSFDDLRSRDIRFFEAAAQLGVVQVWLWPDETVRALTGKPPRFPAAERLYLLQAIRYVSRVRLAPEGVASHCLPEAESLDSGLWVVEARDDHALKRSLCERHGLGYRVLTADELPDFPDRNALPKTDGTGRKKVVVSGCFDWFHSGHVRFFEEVSALGDLYVVVGSDRNVRLLKGKSHPLFPEAERRYLVQSVRTVKGALISSGSGWMDAEPEIAWLRPDIYVVNEDGDKPEKQAFCREHHLQYVVLKRTPAPGLSRRQSTDLRGF